MSGVGKKRGELLLGPLCLAATVLALVLGGLTPSSVLARSESDWLGRINEIRVGSQLPPVVDEPAWSAGILAHLNYIALTPSDLMTGPYANLHTENPASPYYTEAGAKEGESSNLGISSTPVGAIDLWLAAPFHAVGILRAGLQRVGFAHEEGGDQAGLDVINGLDDEVPLRQVLFPGPGSTIDLARFWGESPSPVETCEHQHPGASYAEPGLPLIAMLTTPPTANLTARLRQPDGAVLSSSGAELCVVTADDFVSTDEVYGSTGRSILQGDNVVLLIPQRPLLAGVYSAEIDQPGESPISWKFTSRPKISERPLENPSLRLRAKGRSLTLSASPVLRGHLAEVAIQRNWVPCALILHAPQCTWVLKGHIQHRRIRLSRRVKIPFKPPGRWERVSVHVRTDGFVTPSFRYTRAIASILFRGPKPHHAAR